MKWSKEEDLLLINNYQLKKEEIIKLLPNRSSAAINIRASKLNLKKERNEYKNSELDILLEESHLAYYLVGFILADGSIDNNRLTITLSTKDKEHLEKIASILKTNTRYYQYKRDSLTSPICESITISCQDKCIIPNLVKKFDFKKAKTYNPPDFTKLNLDPKLLISLFIGFIDGDGSIQKRFNKNYFLIKIKNHSSWLIFLSYFHTIIEKEFGFKLPKPKLNKLGYSEFSITNSIILKEIKKNAIKNNLPILTRKWDLIDLSIIFKEEYYQDIKNNIFKLYQTGISQTKIAKKLNISDAFVSKTISHFRKVGAI